MSKKERKEALEFILGNEVIVRKISTAIGCEKKMSLKERKVLVKDMIKTYFRDNDTDSFTVNIFGPGKKNRQGIFNNYRDDRFDMEQFDLDEDNSKSIRNDILDRIIRK